MSSIQHNEYFQRDWMKADAFRIKVLQPIIDELNTQTKGTEAWKLEPVDRDDHPPHWHRIEGKPFSLQAELNQHGRIEVTLGRWPTFESVGGTSGTVTPRDLRPQPDDARMTAAVDRAPAAIANEIRRKVIEPGAEIMARLQAIADERTAWARESIRLQDELAASIGETIHRRSDQITLYARNIPGETVRVEYRGPKSVRLEVTAEEAIELLDRLRELRQISELRQEVTA